MSETGYFLVVDVLGFGRIVRNSGDAQLEGRVASWVQLVESTATRFHLKRFQLIADTLFVAAPSRTEQIAMLIEFCRQLLVDALEQSFPLRGAIVHDTFVWGSMIYGRAVIAARELQQKQNWIGVTCSPNLPGVDELWSADGLVCYPAPLKGAPMRLHPVVAWPIPDVERLLNLLTRGNLTAAGEPVDWNIGEKANNTALFGLYLDSLRASGSPPSTFRGALPVHALVSGCADGRSAAGS